MLLFSDYSEAAMRTVLRFVDLIPYVLPYLLGAILIWSSYNDKKQRLGDHIAHTVVVKKNVMRQRAPISS